MSFESMKRNIESESYIYAYGYDDQNTIQDVSTRKEGLFDRPRARLLHYGYSLSYAVNSDIKVKLFLLTS